MLDILFKNDQPQKAVPGGSTFNSIVSLGRAGVNCVMVTEVGGDHIGEMTCKFLRNNGVSDEFVCRHKGTKSHVTLAFLDENNDAQYTFYKDHASAALDGLTIERMNELMKEGDVVLFGSFFAINPAIRPAVSTLLHNARKAGAWLYYDINFRKTHIPDIPDVIGNIEENMRLADVVRGSKEDFEYLYGVSDADVIYEKVQPFCNRFILTDGAKEIRVYTPDQSERTKMKIERFAVEPIDTVSTVGAGDNFNAGYIYAKLKGLDSPAERVKMAQRWSQDVCKQIGNNISDELVEELKGERYYNKSI